MPDTVIAPFTSAEWVEWAKWIKDAHGVTNEEIQVFLGIRRATDWKHSLDEATARVLEQKEARDEAFKQVVGDDDPPLDPGNVPLDPEPEPEPSRPADYAPGTVFHHTGMVSTEIELNGYRFVIDARGGDTPEMIASRFEALIGGLKLIGKKREGIKPYHLNLLSQSAAPATPAEPEVHTREYFGFKRFVDGEDKKLTLPFFNEMSGKESQYPDIVNTQGFRLFDKAMEEAGLKLADFEHGKLVKAKIVGSWKKGKLMKKEKPEDEDKYYRTWLGFTITP